LTHTLWSPAEDQLEPFAVIHPATSKMCPLCDREILGDEIWCFALIFESRDSSVV